MPLARPTPTTGVPWRATAARREQFFVGHHVHRRRHHDVGAVDADNGRAVPRADSEAQQEFPPRGGRLLATDTVDEAAVGVVAGSLGARASDHRPYHLSPAADVPQASRVAQLVQQFDSAHLHRHHHPCTGPARASGMLAVGGADPDEGRPRQDDLAQSPSQFPVPNEACSAAHGSAWTRRVRSSGLGRRAKCGVCQGPTLLRCTGCHRPLCIACARAHRPCTA